jgi:hypothetical protein
VKLKGYGADLGGWSGWCRAQKQSGAEPRWHEAGEVPSLRTAPQSSGVVVRPQWPGVELLETGGDERLRARCCWRSHSATETPTAQNTGIWGCGPGLYWGRPNVGKRLAINSLFGVVSSSITYVTLQHYLKKMCHFTRTVRPCGLQACRGIKLVLPYVLSIVSPVSLSLSLTHSVSLPRVHLLMRVIMRNAGPAVCPTKSTTQFGTVVLIPGGSSCGLMAQIQV